MGDAALGRPGVVVIESGPERAFGVSHAVVDGDEVVSVMPSGPHLLGPAGLPPGGAAGVLIDDILGFAIMLERPANLWSVSAEISLDLCRTLPSDGSPIIARGRHAHAGPHAGFATGTVTDSAGRLLASCTQHGRWVTTIPSGPQQAPAQPAPAQPAPAQPGSAVSTAPDLAAMLGARVRLTEGGARLELDVTRDVTNPLGNLHGGVTFAACDLVAQAAISAAGGPVQTASIHVAYPRPIPQGTTPRFDARVLHRGRVLGIVAVRVTVDGVKPCAIATITTGVPQE
jgi:uncharacterized protein (TIGR00369 family)